MFRQICAVECHERTPTSQFHVIAIISVLRSWQIFSECFDYGLPVSFYRDGCFVIPSFHLLIEQGAHPLCMLGISRHCHLATRSFPPGWRQKHVRKSAKLSTFLSQTPGVGKIWWDLSLVSERYTDSHCWVTHSRWPNGVVIANVTSHGPTVFMSRFMAMARWWIVLTDAGAKYAESQHQDRQRWGTVPRVDWFTGRTLNPWSAVTRKWCLYYWLL